MKIQDILYKNSILIDFQAQNKLNTIRQMGNFLASLNSVKNPEELVNKILERETDISTGIGYGIAIPHARTTLVNQICMVAARCIEGIEFNAIDEQPVHLIFMLASPPTQADEHRNILSSLSKIMSYEEMRKKLFAATDAEQFYTLLVDGENKYVS